MWRGPEFEDDFPSLGWGLLEWWADFLPSPLDASRPFILTDEQAALVVRWYGLDPRTGRFVFRRGASRRAKGWGKSPLEAAKAIAEFAGPVRFDGWDANGEPVGRPWGLMGDPPPWVQIAAVSEDQTENTYSALYEFLVGNDAAAADDLGIDVGLTRCHMRGGPGKLEPVTAAAGSREGQRVTYGVLDETHLWTVRNGGVRLARTLRRNVSKMGGRSYETTNSFVPGEGSVAEGTHTAVEKGAAGVFYDAVEAPEVRPEDSDERLREAFAVAYGGAFWVDLGRLVQEARDPGMPWEDVERFYLNHNRDDRARAVEPNVWRALARLDVVVPGGSYVALGFDGSISDDCTALIGCRVEDGVAHLFEVEVWRRPDDAPRGWRIPRGDVQARVAEAFAYFDVGMMFCDPAKWQTEIEGWAEVYGEERVVLFDTNQPTRMWRACDRFSTAIAEAAVSHSGDGLLSEHVLAMFRRKVRVRDEDDDGRTKFVFVKGPDREKIDAGIGAVLAVEAAAAMPEQSRYDLLRSFW